MHAWISHALQACGKPVGVHISRARSLEQATEDELLSPTEDFDFDAALAKLLRILRGHGDRKAAVAAATKAALAVHSKFKQGTAEK